ncbi:hypothetical protein EYF80_065616 [Liparis tanakae]|uniref:Uncharacterized protein n=1 Tax=Liparis tanakae TaxID=230148 RepID=A0A4Z2E677_9TELE|nr:hypothetical protein EYF80_065616 [Liparis tanakae]
MKISSLQRRRRGGAEEAQRRREEAQRGAEDSPLCSEKGRCGSGWKCCGFACFLRDMLAAHRRENNSGRRVQKLLKKLRKSSPSTAHVPRYDYQ